MNNIESFKNNEIGLACKTFDDDDMKLLSKYIDIRVEWNHCYNLYDYAIDCRNEWDVIIMEDGALNAYRDGSFEAFKKEHEILTAHEILVNSGIISDKEINVSDDEIFEMFGE